MTVPPTLPIGATDGAEDRATNARRRAGGAALERAHTHARAWLDSLPERAVPPHADFEAVRHTFADDLQDGPTDPEVVVDELAALVEPGLMAMPSGRFFGWVIGGTLPAALAADWLVSAWDQNTALNYATPGTAAAEDAAARWLLDILGLPTGAAVGFTTGGTMANFTGLAAGRAHVLDEVGWDLQRDGLTGAPRLRVLVGEQRHDTIDLALRYLGLGTPEAVATDGQGRIRPDALADALADYDGPTIVCLQAGNIHSGAFDPIGDAADIAHDHSAWVHLDGAFGLWAAASTQLRPLLDGYQRADSWSTDAHKTLNVPYDCGISVVAQPAVMQRAMGVHGPYLMQAAGVSDPADRVPELSRRARGVPVCAALRSLGRCGVAELVDTLVDHARVLATGVADIDGAHVLNDVVFTQVSVSFGSNERTRAVTSRLIADGTVWMSGSRWHGKDVLRISVSNWSTNERDVTAALAAVRRASVACS